MAKRGVCKCSVRGQRLKLERREIVTETRCSEHREVPEKRRPPLDGLSPKKQKSGVKGREMDRSVDFLFYLDHQPCDSTRPVTCSTITTSMETKIKFVCALNFVEV